MNDETRQRTWTNGCAIGCTAVAAALLVAGVITYRIASSRLVHTRDEIRDTFARTYAEWEHVGRIPEEHRSLLDALLATTRGERATVYGVAAVSAAIRCAMQDETITTQEIEMLETLKRLLTEKPGPSLIDVVQFRDQFPDLNAFSEREQP